MKHVKLHPHAICTLFKSSTVIFAFLLRLRCIFFFAVMLQIYNNSTLVWNINEPMWFAADQSQWQDCLEVSLWYCGFGTLCCTVYSEGCLMTTKWTSIFIGVAHHCITRVLCWCSSSEANGVISAWTWNNTVWRNFYGLGYIGSQIWWPQWTLLTSESMTLWIRSYVFSERQASPAKQCPRCTGPLLGIAWMAQNHWSVSESGLMAPKGLATLAS